MNHRRSPMAMRAASSVASSSVRSPAQYQQCSPILTAETNTAIPSARPFIPSAKMLDHSLVVRDNTQLARLSASYNYLGIGSRSSSNNITTGPVRQHVRSNTPPGVLDPEHTNDDELIRFPTAVVPQAALAGVQLSPSEFGRITSDVERTGAEHCPPAWESEELDWNSVPGASDPYRHRALRSKL
jgi:hypothetical protein